MISFIAPNTVAPNSIVFTQQLQTSFSSFLHDKQLVQIQLLECFVEQPPPQPSEKCSMYSHTKFVHPRVSMHSFIFCLCTPRKVTCLCSAGNSMLFQAS